jgi:hypothetical protein
MKRRDCFTLPYEHTFSIRYNNLIEARQKKNSADAFIDYGLPTLG